MPGNSNCNARIATTVEGSCIYEKSAKVDSKDQIFAFLRGNYQIKPNSCKNDNVTKSYFKQNLQFINSAPSSSPTEVTLACMEIVPSQLHGSDGVLAEV